MWKVEDFSIVDSQFIAKGGEEMIFRLKYDGELLSERRGSFSRIENKHQIRKQIHRQLAVLWKSAYALKTYGSAKRSDGKTELEWLSQNYSRCGFRFVPLISTHWRLLCDLDILFLRGDEPGKLIKSGGDIDNRIKTLFDALRIPSDLSEIGEKVQPGADEDPFYCLLENDSLIGGFRVTTDRLLYPESAGEDIDDVSLIITVKVFPSEVTMGSVLFAS